MTDDTIIKQRIGGRSVRVIAHVTASPPSWFTIYQLTQLPPPEFDAAIADGTINPDMTREQLRAFRRRLREQADKALIAVFAAAALINAGTCFSRGPGG